MKIKPNAAIITPLDGVIIPLLMDLQSKVPIVFDDIVIDDCTSREGLAA